MNLNKWTKLKNSGIYIFLENLFTKRIVYVLAFIGITIVFLNNGENIWAEIVAEYMKYSQGEKISTSFAGYITIFPIIFGYIYSIFLGKSSISWFEFSTIVSYIYTLLCIGLVIKVAENRLCKKAILIMIIPTLSVLAHPSASNLINVSHLGYLPIITYIISIIFSEENFEEGIENIPTIVYIPLIISTISKPSFSFIIFLGILVLTKIYRKPFDFIILLLSSIVSIVQIVLYSHGTVNLNINSINSIIKLIIISFQSVGNSLVFASIYYIEGSISKLLLLLSIILGIILFILIIYKMVKKPYYISLIKVFILVSIIGSTIIPYISLDYSMPLTKLMEDSAKISLGKYKIQYQILSSSIIIQTIIFFIKLKIKNNKRQNILLFFVSILCINGLLSGIYTSKFQEVNKIKDDALVYRENQVFMYPPLPDWDWSWSDRAINGWIRGNSYTKYINKPNELGKEFMNLNQENLPPICKGKVFVMISDPEYKYSSNTNYLKGIFNKYSDEDYLINGIKVHVSKPSSNGIRYGVINYYDDVVKEFFKENVEVIESNTGKVINSDNVNFVLVY